MLKKLVFVFAIFVVLVSCNQKSEEGTALTIDEFEMKAGDLVGQLVVIEGTVNHVCKEGGKRMFIINEDPDMSIKIIPDDNMPSFDAEMEGNEVIITGTIVEDFIIDKNYLDEWEAEINKKYEEAMAAADTMPEMEVAETIEEPAEEVAEENHEEGHADVAETTVEGGDGAGHGDHHLSGLEKVEKWRKKLADSGQDNIVIYMIKASKIEQKAE